MKRDQNNFSINSTSVAEGHSDHGADGMFAKEPDAKRRTNGGDGNDAVIELTNKFNNCPLCGAGVSSPELNSHVNGHLDEEELKRDREMAERLHQEGKQEHMHEENKGRGGDGATTHDDATTNEEREVGTGDMKDSHAKLQAETQALVGEQGQARRCKVEEGIMSLLRRCLLAENQGCSRAALSGYVEHYASQRKEDMGWGCGWRNIQMLSSNLLHCDEEMRGALFGGAGFVPDIRGLQQWLEFAWRGGFDEVGAGQLDWKVVGTHKWIGTTECAALLRSFGLRAYIVDFKSSGRGHVAPAEHKKGGQEVGRRGHSRKPGRRRQGRDANGGHTLDKWRKEREQGERRGRQQGNSAGGSGACKKGQGARDERGKVGRSSPRGGRQNKRGGSTECDAEDEDEDKAEQGAATSERGGGGGGDGDGDSDGDGDGDDQQCDTCEVAPTRTYSREDYKVCPTCMANAKREESGEGEGDEEAESPAEGEEKKSDRDSVEGQSSKHMMRDKGSMQTGTKPRDAGTGGNEDDVGDRSNHMRLIEWVWDHFTEDRDKPSNAFEALGEPVYLSSKPPLYFQQQGHSRTIVGIERRRPQAGQPEEVFLLVLDPSQKTEELVGSLRSGKGWQKMVKRGIHTLRKTEYQLCYVEQGLATGEEKEELKVLQSVLHSY